MIYLWTCIRSQGNTSIHDKIKKSGEYVDDDILLNIYEMVVKARIDTNCYKAKRILVADLKSKNTSVEDIKEAELKLVNNKLQGYQDKKIAWKLQTMPTGILAFILCSSPGKKLACLEVEGAKNKNIEGSLLIPGNPVIVAGHSR